VGYALATVIFLVASVAVTGALPNGEIASSARPVAMAAGRTLGPAAGAIIGVAAIIAGDRDAERVDPDGGAHPASRRRATGSSSAGWGGAPALRHAARGADRGDGGVERHAPALLPEVAAGRVQLHRAAVGADDAHPPPVRRRRRADAGPPRPRALHAASGGGRTWVAPIAFAFVLYTVYGVGPEVVLWGFLILLAGTPLYIWFATRES
jgi:hypothetical protein